MPASLPEAGALRIRMPPACGLLQQHTGPDDGSASCAVEAADGRTFMVCVLLGGDEGGDGCCSGGPSPGRWATAHAGNWAPELHLCCQQLSAELLIQGCCSRGCLWLSFSGKQYSV